MINFNLSFNSSLEGITSVNSLIKTLKVIFLKHIWKYVSENKYKNSIACQNLVEDYGEKK